MFSAAILNILAQEANQNTGDVISNWFTHLILWYGINHQPKIQGCAILKQVKRHRNWVEKQRNLKETKGKCVKQKKLIDTSSESTLTLLLKNFSYQHQSRKLLAILTEAITYLSTCHKSSYTFWWLGQASLSEFEALSEVSIRPGKYYQERRNTLCWK